MDAIAHLGPGVAARPRSGAASGPDRTVIWALGGYLVAVAVGVAVVGVAASDLLTGLALGAAFLLAAAVVVVTFWRFSQRAYGQQEMYRRELFDAEMGALARLREAGQMREDVIASVSHEFRTPLTAIRGTAATLLARGDRMRPADRDGLLAGVIEHSDRLGRLLEDMLVAASAAGAADAGSISDVSAAVSAFALGQGRPPVTLEVEPLLGAYLDAVSLDQIVRALADHVRAEARRDRPVLVQARREATEVLIDLRYAPGRSGQDLRPLFEPFGSRESAATGRPASLALYVARRLAEANGGRVSATAAGRDIRIRVALRSLRSAEELPATGRRGVGPFGPGAAGAGHAGTAAAAGGQRVAVAPATASR